MGMLKLGPRLRAHWTLCSMGQSAINSGQDNYIHRSHVAFIFSHPRTADPDHAVGRGFSTTFLPCCCPSQHRSSYHWAWVVQKRRSSCAEIFRRLKAHRLLRTCGWLPCSGCSANAACTACASQAPSSSSRPIKTRFLAALEICSTVKANYEPLGKIEWTHRTTSRPKRFTTLQKAKLHGPVACEFVLTLDTKQRHHTE